MSTRTWTDGPALRGAGAQTLTLAIIVAYALQAAAAYAWTSIGGGLAAIWLGNGVIAAGLVLLPVRRALPLLLAATVLDLSSAVWLGQVPLGEALRVVAMDQFEALLAALLLRRFGGAGLDPVSMRSALVLLLLCILPATLAAGSLGVLLTWAVGAPATAELWYTWCSGDFLGMVLSLPTTLIFARPKRHHVFPAALDPTNLGIVALVLAITMVFATLPAPRGIALLIVVAAFLASLRLPTSLVAVMNIGIVFICTMSTLSGGGFAERWPGTDMARFLLLQFLTLPIAVCTLLGSALLSDRSRQERRLRHALAAARKAQHKAMSADRVKARFLASISHEMRTPLNSIMGHAELLERTALPGAEMRRVEAIRASGQTLSQLIDDVLDFTQIDGGRIEMQPVAFDLEALCREALLDAEVMAAGRPINFHLDLPANIAVWREGDARRLQQVLRQLLSNAVKFTPSGEVRLQVRERRIDGEPVVTFATIDTGIGLDEADLLRIFKPFSQVDESSRRRFGGAGLGLAIARGIIDAMGGTVGVESQLGRGSRFWFAINLPQSRRDAVADGARGLPDADSPLRALVVDDHAVNRELAATFMEAMGFEVVRAENGRQAVEAVVREHFDVVLMDLHMPVLDGLEATREIRRLPGQGAHVAIIALTAAASDDAIRECREAGMTAHLPKPIRGEALLAALHEALAA